HASAWRELRGTADRARPVGTWRPYPRDRSGPGTRVLVCRKGIAHGATADRHRRTSRRAGGAAGRIRTLERQTAGVAAAPVAAASARRHADFRDARRATRS